MNFYQAQIDATIQEIKDAGHKIFMIVLGGDDMKGSSETRIVYRRTDGKWAFRGLAEGHDAYDGEVVRDDPAEFGTHIFRDVATCYMDDDDERAIGKDGFFFRKD